MMCEFCESEDATLFCSYLRMYVCSSCHEYEKYRYDDHFCSFEERAPQSPGTLGPEGKGPQVSWGIS